MRKLIKRDDTSGREVEIELTPLLVDTIARFNEGLTPDQVEDHLMAGKRVHTFFSSYKIEDRP